MVIVRDPESSRVSGPSGKVPSQQTHTSGHSPRILATLQSPPLLEVLRVINKESHNYFAETVLKTLGRTVLGDGSFEGGAEAVERFLASVVGIDQAHVQVQDGSGLSTENRATPGVFVRTLEYMSGTSHWEAFQETLPEAGVRRDLRRMYNSPAARNLRAKTGTMDSVSALSGVVRTRSGERVLFSILSNRVTSEYRAKRAEDQIGIRLASLTRPFPD
jgi:D-alanyl-D-alanine carboxypeptidase/D-alanyl-D-alanine-endopeptidase (penicillin-binding protein 4)